MFCRLLIANSVKYRFFITYSQIQTLVLLAEDCEFFLLQNFREINFLIKNCTWTWFHEKKKKIKNGVAQSFFINNSYWVNWFHGIFREILVNIYMYVFTTFCYIGYVAFVQIFFIQIIVKLMQLNSSTDFGLIQSFVNFMSFWSSICLK